MEILIIQSSPHKTGNTVTIVDTFINSIDKNIINNINRFDLNEMHIKPCQGCFKCSSGHCFINDDMQMIYPRFNSADLIIFATPIFWWHMNAQMKLLIDRMTALLEPDGSIPVLNNKRVVLFITYKHKETAEATTSMFKDFIDWVKVKLNIIEYCSKEHHVRECKMKLDEVKKLAEKINEAYC